MRLTKETARCGWPLEQTSVKGLQRPFLHEDKLTWGRIVASADLQPVQLTTVTTSLHNSDQAVHPNHKVIVRSIRWGAAQQQRFGKMCIYNYQLFINVSQYSCQAVEDSYMRMSRYVCSCSNTIESKLSQNWALSLLPLWRELWTNIVCRETRGQVETRVKSQIRGLCSKHTGLRAAVGGALHEVETALWPPVPPVWTANSLKSGSWLFSCGWKWVALPPFLFDQGAETDRETTLEYLFSVTGGGEAWDEVGGNAYVLDFTTSVGIPRRTTCLGPGATSRSVWAS